MVLGLALLISFWLVWVGVRLLQKAGRSGGLCALTPREARRLAFWHLAAVVGRSRRESGYPKPVDTAAS